MTVLPKVFIWSSAQKGALFKYSEEHERGHFWVRYIGVHTEPDSPQNPGENICKEGVQVKDILSSRGINGEDTARV